MIVTGVMASGNHGPRGVKQPLLSQGIRVESPGSLQARARSCFRSHPARCPRYSRPERICRASAIGCSRARVRSPAASPCLRRPRTSNRFLRQLGQCQQHGFPRIPCWQRLRSSSQQETQRAGETFFKRVRPCPILARAIRQVGSAYYPQARVDVWNEGVEPELTRGDMTGGLG